MYDVVNVGVQVTVRLGLLVVLVVTGSLIAALAVIGVSAAYYASAPRLIGNYAGEGVFSWVNARPEPMGILVTLNVSSPDSIWFAGDIREITLDLTVEKTAVSVQNISWRLFWVKLWTRENSGWHKVGQGLQAVSGSKLIDGYEWNDSSLRRQLSIPVDTFNYDNLDLSMHRAWVAVDVGMQVFKDNQSYSFDYSTPKTELSYITIVPIVYTPMSLGTITYAFVATASIAAIVVMRNRADRLLQSKTRFQSSHSRK